MTFQILQELVYIEAHSLKSLFEEWHKMMQIYKQTSLC